MNFEDIKLIRGPGDLPHPLTPSLIQRVHKKRACGSSILVDVPLTLSALQTGGFHLHPALLGRRDDIAP